MASIHDKLERVRRPRVHIKYQVETDGALVERELPFVVGVMGDFSGNPEGPKRPLKERKFIQIDQDNFDSVMGRIGPELHIKVTDTMSGEKDKDMKVDLKFTSMDSFEPGRVAEQIPALQKLIDTRNKLRDLMTKVDRSDELERVIEQVLQKDEELKKLSSQLGLESSGEKQ
ncbi:MAG TPA: type VI secretion system contractile sheath small subunit [Steroidobacteraceae bacterium]|jgi:type VI secretion system protein ImpB